MTVAVTGATGFVGRHFVSALLERGDRPVLIVRDGRRVSDSVRRGDVRVVKAALSDGSALYAAMTGCDAVVHCAGINRERGGETYQRVHIDGTRSVVEAAERAGVRKLV